MKANKTNGKPTEHSPQINSSLIVLGVRRSSEDHRLADSIMANMANIMHGLEDRAARAIYEHRDHEVALLEQAASEAREFYCGTLYRVRQLLRDRVTEVGNLPES